MSLRLITVCSQLQEKEQAWYTGLQQFFLHVFCFRTISVGIMVKDIVQKYCKRIRITCFFNGVIEVIVKL